MPAWARLAAVGLLAGLLAGLTGLAMPAPLASRPAADNDGPCVLDARREIAPRQVGFMGTTTVTLGLRVACVPARRPLHIVLVVDASREMTNNQLNALKKGLIDAIRDGERVKLAEHDWVKIGVVSFSGASEAIALRPYLSNDTNTIAAALADIRTDGSVCPLNPDFECGPSLGLREALSLLRTAHEGDPRQVVLLATAGDYKPVCDGIRQRASELASNGALLVTACAGDPNNCERGCLRDIVAHDRFYFRSPDWTYFSEVLGQIIDAEGPFNPVEGLTVVDDLPDALSFAGSQDPGIVVEPGRLTWDFPLSQTGATEWTITRTHRLKALECGQIQSSRGVTATLRYNPVVWGNQSHSYGLPNPVLVVPCPTATPTMTRVASATPRSATPTATSTGTAPTPSPSPTEGIEPSPTPTPSTAATRTWHAYLPILAHHACAASEDASAWDVALLFDVSGTMGEPAGGPFGQRMRLDAARDVAVGGVLGRGLRPGIDRVAVLEFGQEGEVLAPLGPCCDSALAALDRFDRLEWSFPWNAVDRAAALLAAPPARPDARRTIILFTDLAPGDLGAADAALLQDRADAARAAGIDLVAVGLGERADADALARLTGRPDRVFLVRRMTGTDPPALIGRSLRCGG